MKINRRGRAPALIPADGWPRLQAMEPDARTATARRHVGRGGLVRNLLGRLERGESLLLYGGPKLGKTSLLRHLEACLNRAADRPATYVDLAADPRTEAVPPPSSVPPAPYLLLDNCDRLAEGEALQYLASLRQRAGRAVVWAGGRRWRDFAATRPGIAELRLRPVPLAVLLPSEARELAGPGLSGDETDWLLSQGGTHPHALETLRGAMLEAGGEAPRERLIESAIARLEPCFTACLRALRTPTEARVLDYLARRAAPVNPKAVSQALDLPTVKPETDVLAYLGLISRWNMAEGAVLHVGSGAFVRWYVTEADGGRTSAGRYSARPFPAYRFLPGRNPHPRRDPRGHSFGRPEPAPEPVTAENWQASDWYRYGVDLFNHGFWWEAHEVFEALWHAAGHDTEEGQLFQALVQVAGSGLKREVGNVPSAVTLAKHGLRRLARLPGVYMGLDLLALSETLRGVVAGAKAGRPELRLAVTSPRPTDPG